MKENMKFGKGPSNIDPWTLEGLLKAGRNPIVTDDIAFWVSYRGHTFRVLQDTEDRIKAGEDPKVVFMDALRFWRPWIYKTITWIPGVKIELGKGEINPRDRLWEMWASGESTLSTGTSYHWIYLPQGTLRFTSQEYPRFMMELEDTMTKEELYELWKKWK